MIRRRKDGRFYYTPEKNSPIKLNTKTQKEFNDLKGLNTIWGNMTTEQQDNLSKGIDEGIKHYQYRTRKIVN